MTQAFAALSSTEDDALRHRWVKVSKSVGLPWVHELDGAP